MLEVLRGLASASKVPFSEIEAKASKKRVKRGGFERGVVLRSTNLAFDEENDALFSEIKNDLRPRVRLSDLTDHGQHSPRAVLPMDRMLSNESVRRILELNQQSISIRAEMESGQIILTLEHVLDLSQDNQIDLLDIKS